MSINLKKSKKQFTTIVTVAQVINLGKNSFIGASLRGFFLVGSERES